MHGAKVKLIHMSHFGEIHVNKNVEMDLDINDCENINLVRVINRRK
jgi:hypothetical protein